MAELLAFGATSQKTDWPNDDRFVVDEDAGLFLVARGVGPRHGGYHRPVALDPGIQAFVDAVRRGTRQEPRLVLEQAIAATPPPVTPTQAKALFAHLCHPTWTISALLIDGVGAAAVHIGVSRIYLLRGSCLQQVTCDHGLDGGHNDPTARAMFACSESKVLGIQDWGTPDFMDLNLKHGDRFLLCTPGVWCDLSEGTVANVLLDERLSIEAQAKTLVESSPGPRDATAIVAHVGN